MQALMANHKAIVELCRAKLYIGYIQRVVWPRKVMRSPYAAEELTEERKACESWT